MLFFLFILISIPTFFAHSSDVISTNVVHQLPLVDAGLEPLRATILSFFEGKDARSIDDYLTKYSHTFDDVPPQERATKQAEQLFSLATDSAHRILTYYHELPIQLRDTPNRLIADLFEGIDSCDEAHHHNKRQLLISLAQYSFEHADKSVAMPPALAEAILQEFRKLGEERHNAGNKWHQYAAHALVSKISKGVANARDLTESFPAILAAFEKNNESFGHDNGLTLNLAVLARLFVEAKKSPEKLFELRDLAREINKGTANPAPESAPANERAICEAMYNNPYVQALMKVIDEYEAAIKVREPKPQSSLQDENPALDTLKLAFPELCTRIGFIETYRALYAQKLCLVIRNGSDFRPEELSALANVENSVKEQEMHRNEQGSAYETLHLDESNRSQAFFDLGKKILRTRVGMDPDANKLVYDICSLIIKRINRLSERNLSEAEFVVQQRCIYLEFLTDQLRLCYTAYLSIRQHEEKVGRERFESKYGQIKKLFEDCIARSLEAVYTTHRPHMDEAEQTIYRKYLLEMGRISQDPRLMRMVIPTQLANALLEEAFEMAQKNTVVDEELLRYICHAQLSALYHNIINHDHFGITFKWIIEQLEKKKNRMKFEDRSYHFFKMFSGMLHAKNAQEIDRCVRTCTIEFEKIDALNISDPVDGALTNLVGVLGEVACLAKTAGDFADGYIGVTKYGKQWTFKPKYPSTFEFLTTCFPDFANRAAFVRAYETIIDGKPCEVNTDNFSPEENAKLEEAKVLSAAYQEADQLLKTNERNGIEAFLNNEKHVKSFRKGLLCTILSKKLPDEDKCELLKKIQAHPLANDFKPEIERLADHCKRYQTQQELIKKEQEEEIERQEKQKKLEQERATREKNKQLLMQQKSRKDVVESAGSSSNSNADQTPMFAVIKKTPDSPLTIIVPAEMAATPATNEGFNTTISRQQKREQAAQQRAEKARKEKREQRKEREKQRRERRSAKVVERAQDVIEQPVEMTVAVIDQTAMVRAASDLEHELLADVSSDIPENSSHIPEQTHLVVPHAALHKEELPQAESLIAEQMPTSAVTISIENDHALVKEDVVASMPAPQDSALINPQDTTPVVAMQEPTPVQYTMPELMPMIPLQIGYSAQLVHDIRHFYSTKDGIDARDKMKFHIARLFNIWTNIDGWFSFNDGYLQAFCDDLKNLSEDDQKYLRHALNNCADWIRRDRQLINLNLIERIVWMICSRLAARLNSPRAQINTAEWDLIFSNDKEALLRISSILDKAEMGSSEREQSRIALLRTLWRQKRDEYCEQMALQ